MPNLFPAASLIWAAIPSLELEQVCASCLDWGEVESTKNLKETDNPAISAPLHKSS